MKVIIILGRSGVGKTTLAKMIAEKPAVLVPHYISMPQPEMIPAWLKYLHSPKSIIMDDFGLRRDIDTAEWLVHYGRRLVNEIIIIAHYFAQIPPSIRAGATQFWFGAMDNTFLPAAYASKIVLPKEPLTFIGRGDIIKTIKLKLNKGE